MLMVLAINSDWKLPIAYFFTKSLNGNEKASIVLEASKRLHEINAKVISITCAKPTVNFSMIQFLGCKIKDVNNVVIWFKHPHVNYNVYVILDACHVLKLFRNNWANLKILKDGEGQQIDYSFINCVIFSRKRDFV